MSGQLTYPANPAIGFAGMLAQNTNLKQADSYLAAGIVRPGFGVEFNAILGAVNEITVSTDIIQGIAVYSDNIEQDSAGVVQYVDRSQLPVLRSGRIFMTAGEALAVNDPVFLGVAAVPAEVGKVYNDNGGATRATYTKAIVILAAAADGDLTVIEISS